MSSLVGIHGGPIGLISVHGVHILAGTGTGVVLEALAKKVILHVHVSE